MVSFAHSLGEGAGATWCLAWGEGQLACSAHPFGGVEGRGHAQYPAFASDTLFSLLVLKK